MNTTKITSSRIHNIALKEVVTNSPTPERDSAGQRTFTMGETEILNGEKAEVLALQKGIQQADTNLANRVKEFEILNTDFQEKTTSYEASIKAKTDAQEPIKEEIDKQERDVAFFEKHSSPSKKSKVKTGSWFSRNAKSLIIVAIICIVELVSFVATLPIQREVFAWSDIIGRFTFIGAILAMSLITHFVYNQVTGKSKMVVGVCLSATMVLGLVTVVHTLIVALTGEAGSEVAFSFDFDMAESNATPSQKAGIWNSALNNPGLPEMVIAGFFAVISGFIWVFKPDNTKHNNEETSQVDSSTDISFWVDKAKSNLKELKGQLNANIGDIARLNQTFETTTNGYNARVKELSGIAEKFNLDKIEAETKLDALLDEVLKSLHEYRVFFCEMYCEKNCVSSVDYDVVTLEDIRKYYNL